MKVKVFFSDKRFQLSFFGESFVRVLSYCTYLVLSALAFVLFFSDIQSFKWLSIILILFLIDSLLRIGKGEKKIKELKGDEINIARTFTPKTFHILDYAFRKSLATGESFHFSLLKKLLKERSIINVLIRLDVGPSEFLEKADEYSKIESEKKNEEKLLSLVEKLAVEAYKNAFSLDESYIEPRNLFTALALENHPRLSKLFYLFEIIPVDVGQAVLFSRNSRLFSGIRRIPRAFLDFAHIPEGRKKKIMNRAWTARPTPLLDSYSRDLTSLARRKMTGFLVGHEREYEALLCTVSKPGKPNAILVGEPGSGKSAIVGRLARAMVEDEVPKVLFDKRLVSLDISSFISDADEKAISGRIQGIVREILDAGNIVLFIPNVENFFRGTGKKNITPIDFLLPVVKSEAIPIICETYSREFKNFIEARSDFLSQFDVIRVDELSEEEAVKFLIHQSIFLEREFKILITFKAIKKSVELAHRYFRDQILPGSALDLLKQAAAEARREKLKILSDDIVVNVSEEKSKIPIQKAEGMEAEKLLNLEPIIHKKLINQKEAVLGVSRALREYRSGLTRRGGPIASFLFVGPTGVGKTELAKILAEVQFGSRDLIRRFDMSEYQDKKSIFQLVGTPDGSRSGALTDSIFHDPYSLILLDEFEKANSDVLNLFLQVFDDGRLTDNLGRTIDFGNTIIIATSNAHSELIKAEIEKGTPIGSLQNLVRDRLTEYFKPELLNRFSQIVVFRNLLPDEIGEITKLVVGEIEKILKNTHGIFLNTDESAIKKIAELGFSPVFGARPLRQVVSEKVRSVLADKILKKEIDRGNVINLSYEKGQFEFKIVE